MAIPARAFRLAGAALLVAASARAQVERAPGTVPDPPEPWRAFLVNPADGTLTSLTYKDTKEDRRTSVYGYIRLDTPVLEVPYGAPLLFAYRVEMRPKDWAKSDQQGPRKEALYGIEVLMPHPGWKDNTATPDRRYATGRLASVHEEAVGPRKSGLNPKKPEEVSQTYVFWPTGFLPPGEYAVTVGGLFRCDGCGGGGQPFRVLPGPAGSTTSAPPAAPPPAPPAAPVAPRPPQGVAEVTIESTPSNAEVTVDGELVGTTPLRYPLAAGTRQITVSRKGYRPWARQLKVTPGVPVRLLAELEPSGD
jgi:hypothetical protein